MQKEVSIGLTCSKVIVQVMGERLMN